MRRDSIVTNNIQQGQDALSKLMMSKKDIWWLTPLGTAGAVGLQQLIQGAYMRALQTVGTGAIITFVLVGTVAIVSSIITALRQHQK